MLPQSEKEDHVHAQQYISFSSNQNPGHGMVPTTFKVGLHSINKYQTVRLGFPQRHMSLRATRSCQLDSVHCLILKINFNKLFHFQRYSILNIQENSFYSSLNRDGSVIRGESFHNVLDRASFPYYYFHGIISLLLNRSLTIILMFILLTSSFLLNLLFTQ